ncbi:MAG: bifunctional (p)ppGpp synthetase/guanosine-3',5'-bis(diphosphate) 3'-pyrophosphohydrolase [Oscillospiraceae bacterium]|nr:bifunctional (p)ppGpp synthetase/guanosine-3',5'-bis(diphosphate) 3'-pyrophosphohydrolase [Oscillospiraceae bacterium]
MKYEQLKTLLDEHISEHGRHYDLEIIEKAYALAEKMHEGQYRKTGEAYVEHPVAVAAIVLELGLDTTSIVAALLHDVVEDTDVTLEEIEKEFDKETAHLVDGVTKLGKIVLSTQEEQQAENLRKMLLAMSQDIRVMLIKLCDRLHNMRTYEGWKPQKQRDKALETMEIYAPIAHRLGINGIKDELQDICLRILDPIGYEEVRQIIQRGGDAQNYVDHIVEEVRGKLIEFGLLDATVMGRVKSTYGVYRKLYMQGRDLNDIYDIHAVRIILNNVAECYNALMLMHDLYRPIPSRFKDYISTPKQNMYQSLHTSVIGRRGVPFEIQIRTWDMHHTAEYGVAAHWKYKTGVQGQDNMEDKLTWVRQLLESQQDSADASEILSDIKSDLIPDDVFVFTPKGDVINLPYGATVIDFAYAIHSAVGNRMTGAKVNGRIVSIDYKVNTGEIIEVVTGAKDKGPSRDWLNIVTTSEAKSKIRSWFKKERKEENIIEGKELFDRELRRALINVDGEDYTKFVENLAKRQRLNNAEEMFAALGYGGLQLSKVMFKAKEDYAKMLKEAKPDEIKIKTAPIRKTKSSNGVIVEGLDNCLVKFSKCCNPLPGDPIVGFITRGFGVSIHKKSCVNAREELRDEENAGRWVNAYWADNIREDFKATLDIVALESSMVVGEVSMLMTQNRIPVYALNARQMPDHRIEMSITIGVNNTEHLNSMISKIKKHKNVISVIRG